MAPYTVNLLRFVTLASLVAAGLLTAAKRVEPEQKDLLRRFIYFFARCFVTIGFWAFLLWLLSDGTDSPSGLP